MIARLIEYTVIGAGPAGICAVASLLKQGVNPQTIQWIDPLFSVGDFGTKLSKGSGVPGNTSVKTFSDVLGAIYQTVPGLSRVDIPQVAFHALLPEQSCHLSDAAQPFQEVSNRLKQMVVSITATVSDINTVDQGFDLLIHVQDRLAYTAFSKRIILATGSKPKSYALAGQFKHIIDIDPSVAFIRSELESYLDQQTDMQTVAVIGSSHSAALATMHLLQSGCRVKQFMNKSYRYASLKFTAEGQPYTEYDNTGLKGEVAQFTQNLSLVTDAESICYADKLIYYFANHRDELPSLFEQHLTDVSHKVVAIGYEKNDTLRLNGESMLLQVHNNITTEFKATKGLFGVGIAYPQQVETVSGEKEFAVGIAKFWATVNDKNVIAAWCG